MVGLSMAAALLLATGLVGCSSDSGSEGGGAGRPEGGGGGTELPATVVEELDALSVARDGRPRIVDAEGRTVTLRGANLNALGDYYQADPDLPPVLPPTDADWDAMAANGFSVVRLIVHWSKLEPERGTFDEAYVAEIREAVDAAARRGIYTVIDLHQDAWGKAIATPDGVECPEGKERAIGWDGAPEWATLTDGADTCRPEGYREGAPAVAAAFTSFYENRDGIRDAFVATVSKLAATFADEPAVAGYDLFNEPNKVLPDDESIARYTELLTGLVDGIRAAETEAGGFPHLLFVEPIVLYPLPGTLPTEGFTEDRDLVFAPHNYAESITRILTVEQTFDISAQTAEERGWPLWIGEYGVWGTGPEELDVLTRFAAAEDAALAGSAEWQWRQRCGDPHAIGVPGREPTEQQVHLNLVDCPADTDAGPNEAFLAIVGRAYAVRAPGDLTEVRSDPASGRLSVTGTTDGPVGDEEGATELVVWYPGDDEPTVETEDLGIVEATKVNGGWYLTAIPTTPDYTLTATRP